MKNRKINLTKLFKIGILFFGISLLLWNCEKDDFLTLEEKKNEKIKIIDRNYFELNNEIKFQKAIRVINDSKTKKNKKLQSKNSNDIYNFTIDSSKIRKIEKDSIISFTFFVKRDKVDSKFFENLVVEFKSNEEPKAFIIKYKPIKKIKFFKEHNSFNFQGNIEINRIDYNRLNLSAKMICYSTEIVYCTFSGYDNYTGDYHYGTHVATPDCFNYAESNRFSLTQSNCITIEGSGWDSDGYSGGGSTGGGGSGSGPIDTDEEIDIVTSALNYPCADPIHGCSRTANKIASKLNLTENERLWLNEQDENYILDLETFLLENNYSIESKLFAKSALEILSLKELSPTNNIDTFKNRILKITSNLKQWGNPEDEIFAEYIESLVQDFNKMTVGDVYDIYKLTDKQSKILIWKYFAAVIVPIAETAYPFIVYAVTEASLGAALPLLSRIPLAMVTRGVKLEKMIEKTMKLGVQGNQPHIKIFKTHLSPERIAKEMFNSLTKGRIGNIVEVAPNVFQANMGSGNFIIYRTTSKSGFEATLQFNYPKFLINGKPSTLKFTK